MVNAGLISGNSVSSQWTVTAMEKYFDEVDHLDIKFLDISFSGKNAQVLYKGKPLKKYDCLYVKGSFRYAKILRALSDLYEQDPDVFLPYEPKSFTIAHDKLLTQLTLQQKNIPMPTTYLSSTIDAARGVLSNVNYPIIMKFPQGTQGKGVMFADSFASASSILDALHALNQPFIIQEYIETDSCDVRLLVVGDKVVAAMKRRGAGDDVRANLHAGGSSENFFPDVYMQKIAIDVSKAIGAGICGVDILEGLKGPMVIEANVSPGLQGISKSSGVDVADKIARYLFDKTKEKLDSRKNSQTKKILADLNVSDDLLSQDMIMNLDFRGARILLPEVISKLAAFGEGEDVEFKVSKGKVLMKKFM